VPLNVERKLYSAYLLARLITVNRKLHLYRSREQIVFADGNVKQVTRSDARWILVVVFGAWLRYLKKR